MSVIFGTKAETLERLSSVLTTGRVLPQVRFTVAQWQADSQAQLRHVQGAPWASNEVIVRSSAMAEDSANESLAGHFASVAGVAGSEALLEAIETVIASYHDGTDSDQVLVQPMLHDVLMSGVALTLDPSTGGECYVINYDDRTQSTDSVTAGTTNALKTFYYSKSSPVPPPLPLSGVIGVLRELEQQFDNTAIDVEFAVTQDGAVYVLQARPLVAGRDVSAQAEAQKLALSDIERKFRQLNVAHPYLHGSRTVFGVMPDWNPAEIIGVRPRPLALSLYRELITDNIWAYQRDNYGYRNLRSFPLLVSFGGLPYIDVRVSFNSFIPEDLSASLADRLVSYYIDRLIESPSHHDKVEFEIIYTCYTLDLPDRIGLLAEYGFSQEDARELSDKLRTMTNRIIHGETGLWRLDIEKIERLEKRLAVITQSDLDPVARIYWLLEDCKRYGTLPFAGLARAGFIAVQLLRSLVNVGILSEDEYEVFMTTLDSVSSSMTSDLSGMSKGDFLKKYGHLRPGTYDILSPRYDEEPDRYFDWTNTSKALGKKPEFTLSQAQVAQTDELLKAHQMTHDAAGLFNFIKRAIEGREYAKFIFTKSLSEAMTIFRELGEEHGFDVGDCSYASIHTVHELYASSNDPRHVIGRSVEEGRRQYEVTRQLTLPPLIARPSDVWMFEMPEAEPNYITQQQATGHATTPDSERSELKDSVLLIPSADPGFDWIFSHGIAGFITMYGGVNSHMAIRAGELGIPAVIGAGPMLFQQWSGAEVLSLDCGNRQVSVVR